MKTTEQLRELIITQIENEIGQAIPIFPKVFFRVLAKVVAAVFILLYKRVGFYALQRFVKSASWDEIEVNGVLVRPLVLWGELIGVGPPKVGVQAEYNVQFTLEEGAEDQYSTGIKMMHEASKIMFKTVEFLNTTERPICKVRAFADTQGNAGAGDQGNLALTEMTLVKPPAGLGKKVDMLLQTKEGFDAETEAEYRERVVEEYKVRPQGGAYVDFRKWALEVPGIVEAYVYTGYVGEVIVYIADNDGLPSAEQIELVEESITLGTRKPMTAGLSVLPITQTEFSIIVEGLWAPTAALETTAEERIEVALRDFMEGREPFIHGMSIYPRKDRFLTAQLLGIASGMASSVGASVDIVRLYKGGVPIPAYGLGHGETVLVDISFAA